MQHPLQQIINNNVNGATFVTIDTLTTVLLTGGRNNLFQGRLQKQVIGSNVMVFQNKTTNGYENMVRRRLTDEGKDPNGFQLQPRKWGVRISNTPFVEHNDNLYLEVIFLKCGDVSYLLDGQPCDPTTIEGFSARHQEAEQGGLDNKVIVRTYSVDSIGGVAINHHHYVI